MIGVCQEQTRVQDGSALIANIDGGGFHLDTNSSQRSWGRRGCSRSGHRFLNSNPANLWVVVGLAKDPPRQSDKGGFLHTEGLRDTDFEQPKQTQILLIQSSISSINL